MFGAALETCSVIRKPLRFALAAVALCGIAYAANWALEEWRYRALLADRALIAGERDPSVKRETACPDPSDTLVFVVFGQSNAANHGAQRMSAPDRTFDFFDNRCFEGNDPQFSATGRGGSPWPAFAAELRESGETRAILMANVAVGATRIDQWQPGTQHADFLQSEAKALQARGYTINAFLFLQGEADRKTPQPAYRAGLSGVADMTAGLSPAAPLVLSDTSICALVASSQDPVAALSMARASVADERSMVYIGPNTDALGSSYRYDGCHFNRQGLRALGALWAQRIIAIPAAIE